MKRATILAGLCTALAACATASSGGGYSLKPEAANGHSLANLDLEPAALLESRQPAGAVTLQVSDRFSEYGAGFIVAVQNLGGAPQDFGPQNVSATADGAALSVFTPDQLGKRITGAARSNIRATERGAPSFTRDPEDATNAAGLERSFNMYGGCPGGQGRCQVESADVGYSYRAGERDRELNLKSAQEVALRLSRDLSDLNVVLESGAIPPGQIGGGVLVIQPPRAGQTVDITVTFAGQPHTFRYKAQPAAS